MANRIQLYFDKPEAPAILRGADLGPDVKRKDLLEAMVQYAEEYYSQHKKEILSFLELAPVVI